MRQADPAEPSKKTSATACTQERDLGTKNRVTPFYWEFMLHVNSNGTSSHGATNGSTSNGTTSHSNGSSNGFAGHAHVSDGKDDTLEPMKYIVVTGGVVSGLGKGVTISSIGRMLKNCGLRTTSIKIDPYLVRAECGCVALLFF